MPEDLSLRRLLRDHLLAYPHLDDDKIAEDVLSEFKSRPSLLAAVRGEVKQLVANLRRLEVGRNEQRLLHHWASRSMSPAEAVVDNVPDNVPDLREGLFRFHSPLLGREVEYADATIADHQAYLDMLFGQINGLRRTAAIHERAVERCRFHGVDRLRDIPNWQAEVFGGGE